MRDTTTSLESKPLHNPDTQTLWRNFHHMNIHMIPHGDDVIRIDGLAPYCKRTLKIWGFAEWMRFLHQFGPCISNVNIDASELDDRGFAELFTLINKRCRRIKEISLKNLDLS